MPLLAPAITSSILASNPSLVGPSWIQVATGIGIAVQAWALNPSSVSLLGSVSGTIGGGTVTGKFLLNPSPAPLFASLASAGLVGPQATEVAIAVGGGVGTSLNASALYVGVASGAIGVDVSRVVVANPATLIALLTANLSALGLVGPTSPKLSVGLGIGISAMFLTGSGTGVAIGSPGPAPGTGITRSSLL